MNSGQFGGGFPPHNNYPQQAGWPQTPSLGPGAPPAFGPSPGQPPPAPPPGPGYGYTAPPLQAYAPQPAPGGYGQPPGGYAPAPGGYTPAPGGYAPPSGYAQGGYGAPAFGSPAGYATPMGYANAPASFAFEGTGGEFFGKMIGGALLCGITLGIYLPWFLCGLIRYYCEKTRITTPAGQVKVSFTGTGGSLFGVTFVGTLLTMLTLGIYTPWYVCKLTRYFAEHTTGRTDDGRTYQIRFNGQGGDLFGTWIVNALLIGVTLYIYTPWAMCKLRKWFFQRSEILENGQPVGQLDFVGEGGDLFGTFLAGMFLTGITVGIYKPWFSVNMRKFYGSHTRLMFRGRAYTLDFTGTGGDLFVLKLVNGLLTGLTLGIYSFWAKVKELQWEFQNTSVKSA